MSPAGLRRSTAAPLRHDVFAVSDERATGPVAASLLPARCRDRHVDTRASAEQRAPHHLDGLTRLIAEGLAGENRRVWCTITVLESGWPGTAAASGPEARMLESAQLRFGDGPCLKAVRDQVLIHVGDTITDPRWAPYGALTVERGIRSVLAVPFRLAGAEAASLNLRCSRPHAFNSAHIETVQQLVETASGVVRETAELLPHGPAEPGPAGVSRLTVLLAVSLLARQDRCTEQEALSLLTATAHRRGAPLCELAAELVAAALRQDRLVRRTR